MLLVFNSEKKIELKSGRILIPKTIHFLSVVLEIRARASIKFSPTALPWKQSRSFLFAKRPIQ
jgi:hypothetical protein